jgi:sugar O-acyltransferase (sialic acid O-acetyltransferase NeuD family)
MRDLVIIGAGGHGREMLDIVDAMNAVEPRWNFLGFLVDDLDDLTAERVAARGAVVLGPSSEMASLRCAYVVGVGSPSVRERLDVAAEEAGGSPVELRHPTAIVGAANRIGVGCVFGAGSVVTTNVVLGRSVHVNVGASVSHDGRLGDYTILAPGARFAGTVTTGRGVDVGVGAVVKPGVTIGDGAVVGAGAAVVSDVQDGAVVAGVPARRLR